MGAPAFRRRRDPFPIGRWLGAIVRAALLLAIFGGIGLMCWPVEVAETRVDVERARRFAQRLADVEQTLQQQGTAVDTVSADEINNYLAWRLQETPGAGVSGGLQMSLERVRIEVSPTRISAVALGGWGPLKLTFEARGLPEAGNQGFVFRVYRARVGRLWLPPFARPWAVDKLRQALGGLDRERRILDRVQRFELGDGKVRMAASGRG